MQGSCEENPTSFVTGVLGYLRKKNLKNSLAVSAWKAAAAYEVGGRREAKPSEEAEEVAEEREGHRDEQCECCNASNGARRGSHTDMHDVKSNWHAN